MHFRILATVVVYRLVTVCAAPTRHLRDFVDLKSKLNVLSSLSDHSDDRHLHQRFVAPTSVDQHASGKHGVRRKVKRGAIVDGITSWDYEPFDKMGAFRSGRERPSKREVVRSLMSATDDETAEEDVERDYNKLARHPKGLSVDSDPAHWARDAVRVLEQATHLQLDKI